MTVSRRMVDGPKDADGRVTKVERWYTSIWHAGRTIRKSCGAECKSETRAKQIEVQRRVELAKQGPRVHSGRIPVLREAAAEFLQAVEAAVKAKSLRPNTLRHYRNAWDAWLSDSDLAGVRVDRITSGMINAVEFPADPFSRKNGRQALGRILRWCAEEKGYMIAAPKIKGTRTTGRKIRITEEIESALRAHMKRDCSDVLTMMLDECMRNTEVFAMRWDRIDWERKEYHVAKSKSSASQRTIPLSDRAIAMLRGRQESSLRGGMDGHADRLKAPCASPTVANRVEIGAKQVSSPARADSPWVFPSRIGRVGHLTTIAKQFREAREAAGIDKSVKLYCARHTGASELSELGVDLLTLRELLGHEDISTTNKYLHGEAAKARDAINSKQRSRSGLKLEKRA